MAGNKAQKSTAQIKGYEVTVTIGNSMHPGNWWKTIDDAFTAANYQKADSKEGPAIGPTHQTFLGASYEDEVAEKDKLEKKLKLAGLPADFSLAIKQTGGSGTPR